MNVNVTQITNYCESHGFDVQDLRTTPSHVILRECPFCPKPTNGKADNMFKIYVQIGGGAFFCHRCGAKGSWYYFKRMVGGYDIHNTRNLSPSSNLSENRYTKSNPQSKNGGTNGNGNGMNNVSSSQSNNNNLPMPSTRLQALCITNLLDRQTQYSERALEYLTNVRGLEKKTLRKYVSDCIHIVFVVMNQDNMVHMSSQIV